MDNKEYLTIKEFGKLAGVTPQSIYQRLETTLQPYLKVVKGKKYVNIKALKDLYNIDIEQDVKENVKDLEQEIKALEQGYKVANDTIKALEDTLKNLNDQLKDKDSQIVDLRKDKEALQKDKEILQKDKEVFQELIKALEEKNSTIELLSKRQPLAIETVTEEKPQKESIISKWKKMFK